MTQMTREYITFKILRQARWLVRQRFRLLDDDDEDAVNNWPTAANPFLFAGISLSLNARRLSADVDNLFRRHRLCSLIVGV